MIDRPTILRIVLATGPCPPMTFAGNEDRAKQIGATEELLTLAENDAIAVSDRYDANRGRMVGDRRIEWIEQLLASLGNGDIAGAAVRHLAEQLRQCQIENAGLLAQIEELQEESRESRDEIERFEDVGDDEEDDEL